MPRNPIDIQYSSHLANMTILASIDKLLEFNLHSYLSLPECLLLVSCFSNNLRPRQLPHCSVSHTHPPDNCPPGRAPRSTREGSTVTLPASTGERPESTLPLSR